MRQYLLLIVSIVLVTLGRGETYGQNTHLTKCTNALAITSESIVNFGNSADVNSVNWIGVPEGVVSEIQEMPLVDLGLPENVSRAPFMNVNFSIGGFFNFNGGFRMSAAVGFSKQIKIGKNTLMPAINLAGDIYNFGIGARRYTAQNPFLKPELQLDGVMSISTTYGWGGLADLEMPLNTFSNSTRTAIKNPFYNSLTVASNFVVNSKGRNQRVGFFGAKIMGRVALNTYNDIFPYLGDGNDRYWSGVGSIQIALGGEHIFTLGSDIFTEERIAVKEGAEEYLHDETNPAKGMIGTYLQTFEQRLYNNGQTYLSVEGSKYNFSTRYLGKIHMKPQWVVHNQMTSNALFYYENL